MLCDSPDCGAPAVWRCRALTRDGTPFDVVRCGPHAALILGDVRRFGDARWSAFQRIAGFGDDRDEAFAEAA